MYYLKYIIQIKKKNDDKKDCNNDNIENTKSSKTDNSAIIERENEIEFKVERTTLMINEVFDGDINELDHDDINLHNL